MPALEGLNKSYSPKDVQVIGIVLDPQNAERAGTLLERQGAGYINLLDDGTFSMSVDAVPQTFFLDSQGRVLYAYMGWVDSARLKSTVDSLLE